MVPPLSERTSSATALNARRSGQICQENGTANEAKVVERESLLGEKKDLRYPWILCGSEEIPACAQN